jgi:hypothetical protein
MVKVGNRVSLFNNIGKEGKVIGMRKVPTKTWHTNGTASHSWSIIIEWNDGTRSEEAVGDVMRLD